MLNFLYLFAWLGQLKNSVQMTVYQTKQARVIYVDVRYAIEILCKENSNLNTISLFILI